MQKPTFGSDHKFELSILRNISDLKAPLPIARNEVFMFKLTLQEILKLISHCLQKRASTPNHSIDEKKGGCKIL